MRHNTSELENMPQIAIRMPEKRQISRSKRDMDPQVSGSPERKGFSGHPTKEGNVYAVQNVNGKRVRLPVVLKVYASSFGRYAVVGQDKVVCRECGFINLKNCSVRSNLSSPQLDGIGQNFKNHHTLSSVPKTSSTLSSLPSTPGGQYSFQLIPHNAEGQTLSFMVSSKTDLEQWISVLVPSKEGTVTDNGSIVITGSSPSRTALGELSPLRVGSPRLGQKSIMPALEEE